MTASTLARFLFGGWGQRAAWVVLLVFLALQTVAPALFHVPRVALFDLYQSQAPRLNHWSHVTIVDVGDASIKAVGQWPWPRHLLAEMITTIRAANPAAIGLDFILPEPDRSSPETWLQDAGKMPAALSTEIRKLPSHDAAFAEAIKGGGVMLGVGGQYLDHAQEDTGPLTPFRVYDRSTKPTPPATLPTFDASVRSIALLDHAASAHGLLSVDRDPDGVIRRLPLVSLIGKRLAPSFSLEILRLAAKKPFIDLHLKDGRVEGIGVGKDRLPTQADGSMWVHFGPHDPKRFVSAADVLAGRTPAERFDGKMVLIGVSGLGTTDMHQTPAGFMLGTEINAQFLENVAELHIVQRPDWVAWLEPLLTLVFGIVLIVALRFVRPRWQLLCLVPLFAVLGAIGVAYWRSLLLVDVATPALGQALVFLAFLGGSFIEADAHRRQLRRELEARKLAAARIEGEMEAARRIQLGLLPGAASVAGDRRFDLGALMVPARQIGGDLYDFFKIDAHRLFFTVGDVSGKGVPAALFMALGKSLCKSYALRDETDVGAIVTLANAEIARDNPEMLFITMFAGILDLDSGEVAFANAGHDLPYVLRKDVALEAVVSEGGPPLCVVDDFTYKTETLRLKPGDLLCVMTDGVTEAMDASGALLGVDRTKAILAGLRAGVSAKTVVDELYAGVGRFVAGADASDDLTVLAVRWNGPATAIDDANAQ